MSDKRFTGGPKVRVAGFLVPELGSIRTAAGDDHGFGEKKMGATAPSGSLRNFHPHRLHQFLEAHKVEHPFEVVRQRRQTPLRSYLRQALEQKMRVAEPSLDRAIGMFGQRLP